MDELTFDTTHVEARGVRISATVGGEEVGHVYLYVLHNDSRATPFAFTEDLVVHETYRRRGIATALAKRCIALAVELGCYKIIGASRFGRDDQHRRLQGYGLGLWGYEFRKDLN